MGDGVLGGLDQAGGRAAGDKAGLRIPGRRSPDLAAVLAILVPGLGHVYAGRLRAGLLWLLAIGLGYWLIFLPGAVLHAISIWSAYRSVRGEAERRS